MNTKRNNVVNSKPADAPYKSGKPKAESGFAKPASSPRAPLTPDLRPPTSPPTPDLRHLNPPPTPDPRIPNPPEGPPTPDLRPLTPRRRRQRRGVLLLVVLSMLIMFLMTGVAFVVIAKHYSDAQKSVTKTDAADNAEPNNLLDSALYDILRDTKNPASRVRYHSLLGDLYGVESFDIDIEECGITAVLSLGATGDQFIDMNVQYGSTVTPMLSPIVGYYNGRVLTMKNGPFAGVSTRIVGYQPVDNRNFVFRVLAFKNDNGTSGGVLPQASSASDVPYIGSDEFVVNGAPFNGTGFGYNSRKLNTPLLDMMEDLNFNNGVAQNRLLALMPNSAFLPQIDPSAGTNAIDRRYFLTQTEIGDPNSYDLSDLIAKRGLAGLGGADESYDAADFQNMLLAAVPTQPELPQFSGGNVLVPGNADNIIQPSLHRRALINYWLNQGTKQVNVDSANSRVTSTWNESAYGTYGDNGVTFGAQEAALARKVILRPLPIDHPNFPKLASLVNGPWDVDNDGDGVPDSIWVDLGYPLMATPDGRQYKPMFAILCQDLDGRLNVNAHGTWFDERRKRGNVQLSATPSDASAEVINSILAADSANLVENSFTKLPRGQGYGPAEISFANLPGLTEDQYRDLLSSRYGPEGVGICRPGRVNRMNMQTMNGEPMAAVEFSEAPDQYDPQEFDTSATPALSAYGSPPNLHGRYGIGLSPLGVPVVELNPFRTDLRQATQYAMNLSDTAARGAAKGDWGRDGIWGTDDDNAPKDSPFAVSELERLMRRYDADISETPGRLDAIGLPATASRTLTTDSWDLPVPSVALTREIRDKIRSMNFSVPPLSLLPLEMRRRLESRSNLTIGDFIVVRLIDNNVTSIDSINIALQRLLAHDLQMGLRMDVNRPFGNGRDDDVNTAAGYGVVDDPDESINNTELLWTKVFGTTGPGMAGGNDVEFTPLDANNDGVIDNTDRQLQRQLYARHLYVLMMALTDSGFNHPPDPDDPDAPTADAARTARVIAQWAINAADFKDPDAIMTPFEYDITPFRDDAAPAAGMPDDGTWDVDGLIGSGDDLQPFRGLVWGCERPELLMTESLAWHDRRTEDRNDAGPGDEYSNLHPSMGNDTGFDQRLRPRGAFYVELYNPSSANETLPAELYENGGIVLNKLTPVVPSGVRSPIWRMIVVKGDSHKITTTPDRGPLDPDDPTRAPAFNPTDVDRSIYFTDPAASAITGHGTPFFTTRTIAPLLPGHYAVVGSAGIEDAPASGDYSSFAGRKITPTTPGDHYSGVRRVTLHPNTAMPANGYVEVVDNKTAGMPDIPAADIKNAIPIPIDRPQNLTISEPPTGYTNPPAMSGWYWNPNYTPAGGTIAEGQYEEEGNLGTAQPLPEPDDKADAALWAILSKDGTTPNFRTIHLQRLANPLEPWDADANPYLTVDTLSVDITCFNGVTSDPDPEAITGSKDYFASLQRGEREVEEPVMYPVNRQLWAQEPFHENDSVPGFDVSPAGAGDHFFDHQLENTLGYLNEAYHPYYDAATVAALPATNLDLLGEPQLTANPGESRTFPWLTWNNRPYVSQLELMQVPAVSSSQLLAQFGVEEPSAAMPGKEYDSSSGATEFQNFRAPYKHLLNFFAGELNSTMGAPEYHRLLEFTCVPSHFVGTKIVLNPDLSAFGSIVAPETEGFRPPFNKVSKYRVPGKVNLNTVYDEDVYNGIFHATGTNTSTQPLDGEHATAEWDDFIASRRGSAGTIFNLDPVIPTFFGNPFRASDAGSLVPITVMERQGVDSTILRSDSIGSTLNPDPKPLIRADVKSAGATDAYNDPERNPYFRYQPMQRLANLTTGRSNVYAVWITVGYFEVEPVSDDIKSRYSGPNDPLYLKLYPENVMLGKELGSDTGDLKRHRSFSIIDRSIPVGFEPGENLNVDKAILLNRRIE